MSGFRRRADFRTRPKRDIQPSAALSAVGYGESVKQLERVADRPTWPTVVTNYPSKQPVGYLGEIGVA